MAYNDLRQHLKAVEEKGILGRVKRSINKNTELHPLIRWQFRSNLPEAERKGFLFENVVDSKGKHYDYPVAVGVLASNPQIYAVGLQCSLDEIPATWERALSKPIDPRHRNAGNYRVQLKGRRKIGCYNQPGQHFTLHLEKCREKGVPLEAALVIGGPPIVSYATVQKVPYGVDEMAVAGGLAGEPLRMVRCKTVS